MSHASGSNDQQCPDEVHLYEPRATHQPNFDTLEVEELGSLNLSRFATYHLYHNDVTYVAIKVKLFIKEAGQPTRSLWIVHYKTYAADHGAIASGRWGKPDLSRIDPILSTCFLHVAGEDVPLFDGTDVLLANAAGITVAGRTEAEAHRITHHVECHEAKDIETFTLAVNTEGQISNNQCTIGLTLDPHSARKARLLAAAADPEILRMAGPVTSTRSGHLPFDRLLRAASSIADDTERLGSLLNEPTNSEFAGRAATIGRQGALIYALARLHLLALPDGEDIWQAYQS